LFWGKKRVKYVCWLPLAGEKAIRYRPAIIFCNVNTDNGVSMNYLKHYDLLINRAKSRVKPSGYCERHHVVPRCMGGDNSVENLVWLTASEHYVAHQLLVKMHPGNRKLIFAAIAMSGNGKEHHKRNNKTYGWLREQFKKAGVLDETKKKISNALTGYKRTPEEIEKSRISRTGQKRTDEFKDERRKATIGKKFNNETKKKMSDRMTGKGNHFFGKKHKEATLEKIRQANKRRIVTEESKQKRKETWRLKKIAKELEENRQKLDD
jgi:hypothetical protein